MLDKIVWIIAISTIILFISGCTSLPAIPGTPDNTGPSQTPKAAFSSLLDKLVSNSTEFPITSAPDQYKLSSLKINTARGVTEVEFKLSENYYGEPTQIIKTFYISKQYDINNFVYCHTFSNQKIKESPPECLFNQMNYTQDYVNDLEKFLLTALGGDLDKNLSDSNFSIVGNGCYQMNYNTNILKLCENSVGMLNLSIDINSSRKILAGDVNGHLQEILFNSLETDFARPEISQGIDFKQRFSFNPRICTLDDIVSDLTVYDPSVYDVTFSVNERGSSNVLWTYKSVDKAKTYYTITFKPFDGRGLYQTEPWLLEYMDTNMGQIPKLNIAACTPDKNCVEKSCSLGFGVFIEDKVRNISDPRVCYNYLWGQNFSGGVEESGMCYRYFAIKQSKPELCDLAGDFMEGCYYSLAEKMHDKTYCDKIKDQLSKQGCISTVK